jgi:hypothetical protein
MPRIPGSVTLTPAQGERLTVYDDLLARLPTPPLAQLNEIYVGLRKAQAKKQ